MPLPRLVVFYGGIGGAPIEEMLADAIAEDTIDTLEKVASARAVSGIILATDRPQIAERFDGEIDIDRDSDNNTPFHFGQRLASVIRRYNVDRLIYAGAGSGPLMKGEDFFSLGHYLGMAWNIVLANNFYSSDIVAFVPAEAVFQIDLPANDNMLARLLRDQAGLATQDMPRSTATQFNIDSPGDLVTLKLTGAVGPRLHEWLERADFDLSRHRAVLPILTSKDAEILVSGRVGSQVWHYLEKETACRVRFFSEERGMQASGRDSEGLVRSLVGYHVQEVGCRRFFAELAEMCDAAFIDTRVILAHLHLQPSRADRFLSDIGCYEEIADPFLHEFTEAAVKAPFPVLLGGHSLVAGGIMSLTELAWAEHDRSASTVPPP